MFVSMLIITLQHLLSAGVSRLQQQGIRRDYILQISYLEQTLLEKDSGLLQIPSILYCLVLQPLSDYAHLLD